MPHTHGMVRGIHAGAGKHSHSGLLWNVVGGDCSPACFFGTSGQLQQTKTIEQQLRTIRIKSNKTHQYVIHLDRLSKHSDVQNIPLFPKVVKHASQNQTQVY